MDGAMTASPDYFSQIEAWRADRVARLTAEDGWLNLIGRWELAPGAMNVGAANSNEIVLDIGPDRLGTLTRAPDDTVIFEPARGGETVRIAADAKGPVRFPVGRFLFEVVSLAGIKSLRIRDRDAPARQNFPGIDYFPVDEGWRIVAEWRPLGEPMEVEVDTMIGIPTTLAVTHTAIFERDGVRHELVPTYGTPQAPQFVIRDRTSASETYPASRFLHGEKIEGGTIVLDFNKAFNPPCAYSDFAVCPLPLPQNVLPHAIRAGERKPRPPHP